MDSNSDETNIALARPTWGSRNYILELSVRAVGNWFRLDAGSHGQLLSVLSYLPAMLITPIVTGIALLLYAMGYSLTRPDAMVGGE